MRLHFFIRFHTQFGQSLTITGNSIALGAGDQSKALPMDYLNDAWWHVTVEVNPALETAPLRYQYTLHNIDGTVTMEWGNDRVIDLTANPVQDLRVLDVWNHAGEFENAFYTQPFQQTLLLPAKVAGRKAKSPEKYSHEFRVKAPLLAADEVLCLAGSGAALGNWANNDPVLGRRLDNWWVFKTELAQESFPLAYKYGVYNITTNTFVRFESGDNRLLHYHNNQHEGTILHDGFVQLPNNTWKGAGVAIPVFSLRSEQSFGVGEFADIALLVDWAKRTGLRVIQLLPVNDTTATHTWLDSYPYSAISAYALHPLYINLQKVAGKEQAHLTQSLETTRKELNELADFDYERVIQLKFSTLEQLYSVQYTSLFANEDYQLFFEKNRHWLVPYAVFCYLRDEYGTADFNQWTILNKYDESAVERMVNPQAPQYKKVAFHFFVQYHLHLQLTEAAHYAHQNGIILKGDIPIGIYRFSADAWQAPEQYNMDVQAGAPPDDFAVKGQNWGFPTYNWQRMKADDYSWWRSRFEQMGHYFDAFRIDHILGFFRIWSIPMHAVEGILGHFVPALPVHINELAQRGVSFEYDRFCQPYITDEVLWDLFGTNKDLFHEYLRPEQDGTYRLRPEFATQRQVEQHFAGAIANEETTLLRQGLYDLISNVLLIEQEGSQGLEFHCRIALDQTISFRKLDGRSQQALREIYINYFYYRQDEFWGKEAMAKLPELKQATNMLVCGEDLGMVPRCVPEVMQQLGILSLEVQRMPKQQHMEFFHPANAPYMSVVTPSTHDMSIIRGWWEEDRARTQRFYNYILGKEGYAPYFCEPWVNKAIIDQHLQSPAMWSIFQLQDLLGSSGKLRRDNPQQERINVPANPRHYWRYRMNLTLEQLLKENDFNNELQTAIELSGRDSKLA